MNLDEILSLTEDALAVFGPDAELVAVSPAFRGLFQPVEAFLAPGTPWPLFLTEAVRQDLLQMEASRRLAMIEESLTDPARPAS